MDHNKLWKVIKEMRMSDTLSASCETCMQVKKQHVEMELQQQTGSKLGKECVICISEVIDISPSNLDSSLYFIQPSISHYVLCI